VALNRIINVPARGIGAKTVEELAAWSESRGVSLWEAVGPPAEPEPRPARPRPAGAVFEELMPG
jgi:DNA helicase II / ATP-dependent DNA helicase PcrA